MNYRPRVFVLGSASGGSRADTDLMQSRLTLSALRERCLLGALQLVAEAALWSTSGALSLTFLLSGTPLAVFA